MFATLRQFHELKTHSFTQLDCNGEYEYDSYLEMPDSTATGDLWNPPSAESSHGFDYR
eukprot:CAMPEP_0174915372 /NCGR_PEP_ID=MMETSP1355-20121228/985_1 /TAXON_ID=464990 /ORGANISM="Hemiselmis tepida, Strain CCMP443" /LENGTH=57 /DNA_ID=CAMNT_0016160245 /DNA_START=15 /DNA_END=188 /DNA_ORIENTATION=+